jgi:hypothetical protein
LSVPDHGLHPSIRRPSRRRDAPCFRPCTAARGSRRRRAAACAGPCVLAALSCPDPVARTVRGGTRARNVAPWQGDASELPPATPSARAGRHTAYTVSEEPLVGNGAVPTPGFPLAGGLFVLCFSFLRGGCDFRARFIDRCRPRPRLTRIAVHPLLPPRDGNGWRFPLVAWVCTPSTSYSSHSKYTKYLRTNYMMSTVNQNANAIFFSLRMQSLQHTLSVFKILWSNSSKILSLTSSTTNALKTDEYFCKMIGKEIICYWTVTLAEMY